MHPFMVQQLHDDVDQLARDKKKALAKLNKVFSPAFFSMPTGLL